MKLCRFDDERLGLVDGDDVLDVSAVIDNLPSYRWSRPWADPVIERLNDLRPQINALRASATRQPIADTRLNAPVAMPSKIIGAPVNYRAHLEEARTDAGLNHGRTVQAIDEIGCFLKAGSALTGHGAAITLPMANARIDHEGEVAVVIGKPARAVPADRALNYIAGYALALDMTVRGKQDRSLRKSCDGFAVLGPWLSTADEIADPGAISFDLAVNGETRQAADTGLLIRSIPELIEMCSAFYTLLPGDVIMTGTPEGVGPVASGDRIEVSSPLLGRLAVSIV